MQNALTLMRFSVAGAEPCRLALLIRYLSRSMASLRRVDAPEASGSDPEVLKAAQRLEAFDQDEPPLPCAIHRGGFPEVQVQGLREAVRILQHMRMLYAVAQQGYSWTTPTCINVHHHSPNRGHVLGIYSTAAVLVTPAFTA